MADVSDVVLSTDELNVMRYVAGYIAYKLLKKYEKRSGDVIEQYYCLSW